ncbi:MAG: sensor histidine kinase [Bacteroidota bacterium]
MSHLSAAPPMQLTKSTYKQILHVGFWIIFLLISVFFFANFWPINIAILRALLNGVLFMLVFYINLLVLIPRFFSKKNYALYLLTSFMLIGIFIPVRMAFRIYLFGEPAAIPVPAKPYLSELFIVTSLLFIFMLSVFYKLAENQLLATERNREIIRQRDEAELRMLKSQVNPHFLFNTLNNLYSLAYTRSEKTAGAIISLSEIMRYLIYETSETLVSAEKEIKFLTNYIKLEKLRIEDSGKVSLSVEQPNPGLFISPLIFITFVENAFKHSEIDADPEGFIQVFLSFRKGEIMFICENSIPGTPSEKKEGGIGLINVRARLDLMYPGKTLLEIRHSALVYSVSLTIKL